MTVKKTDKQPAAADSNIDGTTVPDASARVPSRNTPTADWSVEDLAQYVQGKLHEADRLGEMAIDLGRRSVLALFEAGRGLVLIRDKLLPRKGWVAWQREAGLSRTQVNRATRLYEAAGDADALAPFATIGEALSRFGIEEKRPPGPRVSFPTPSKEPEEGTDDTEEPEEDADGDSEQPMPPKEEKQPPTQAQAEQVRCVEGRMEVKRNAISIEADKLRFKRVLPIKSPVSIVSRWRAELKLVIDAGQAVLVLPDLEVADAG